MEREKVGLKQGDVYTEKPQKGSRVFMALFHCKNVL